jgi:hypothetical protein
MTDAGRGLAALALLVAGCSAPRPAVLHGAPAPLSAEDYPAVLETWTRADKLYQGLENKLFITATYHAPELRRAFAIAFPEIYGHGGTVTRQELVDLTAAAEQSNTFFLAVYTPVTQWNDLAQSDSIWRLTLIGDNEVAVSPTAIELVKIDENLRTVYPYIGRFDRCYLARFPLADLMERLVIEPAVTGFRLRVASALGAAELVWTLSPGAAPAASEVLEQKVGE